jgi:membrane fusion protein, epimerase transport system
LAGLLAKEQSLFEARRQALTGQISLLHVQRAKVGQEVQALREQIEQATQSLKHQRDELATNRNLLREGFVSSTRVSQLEAQVADYGVKVEERRSELARAEQRRVDSELRIKSLESDYGKQASEQLKVALGRLSDLQQEQRKTIDAGQRQVIVCARCGRCDGPEVHRTGRGHSAARNHRRHRSLCAGTGGRSACEAGRHRARPPPPGRGAALHGVRRPHHPLIAGKVLYVSADRLVDRQSGNAFYVVNVAADADSLARAGNLKLIAGMPAEVYITGETRTPLRYLMEPVLQVVRRAGRER